MSLIIRSCVFKKLVTQVKDMAIVLSAIYPMVVMNVVEMNNVIVGGNISVLRANIAALENIIFIAIRVDVSLLTEL